MAGLGWVSVDRKIQEHWIWQTDEPFDVRSAWIDLILLANHEDGKYRERGELMTIKRGQHKTSIRKLAARWKWSEGKVRRFLADLEADGMITRHSTQFGTLLTLVNYDFLQGKKHTHGRTGSRTDGRTDGRQTIMNNNDNNNKQIIEPTAPVREKTYAELNEEIGDDW